MYGPYERPPFPIMIDAPTWGDLFRNMKPCDFVMGGAIYGSGMAWGYYCSRPFSMLMQKLVIFHGVSHMFLVVAASMMIALPFRRLTGYWDNGMRWRKPEDRLNKYDCTSHFEESTGYSRFRIKTDE